MSYKIYVVFHKYLLDNCYKKDAQFNINNYIFFKCNELFQAKYNENFGYNIKYEKDCEIYNPKLQDLKKPYMAVSALYHIYKNKIYQDLDYIGFMEYDLSLEPDPVLIKKNPNVESIQKLKNVESMTSLIENTMINNKKLIIILSGRHRFKSFFEENTIINEQNLFYKIVNEYNEHFITNHSVQELLDENPVLGDQQSFLADTKTFEKIMGFMTTIIEGKKAEHKGLRPSFLLARYFGVTIHLMNVPTKLISLKHLNKHEW